MISQSSEYALRAVVYLAQNGDGPAVASDIAAATKVPLGYLHKILRILVRHRILVAQRGAGGGFALAKVPSAISVLDILRATDTLIDRIEQCPLGIPGHTTLCALHHMLDEAVAETARRFSGTSVADLIQPSGRVTPLCEVNAPVSVSTSARSRSSSPSASKRKRT